MSFRHPAAALLVILLAGACSSSPGSSGTAPPPTAPTATATAGTPAPPPGTSPPPASTSASAPSTSVPPPGASASAPTSARPPGPPDATPLAQPPVEPASDGTTATISTALGDIVIELFTQSSPVAAENFINLADAGFYDGVIFHRVIPAFVIQGGDPEGTGRGGPGYEILDDPVVGDYERSIVAMARPGNPDGSKIPDSAGSQFFIILDDLRERLPEEGGYQIFGQVSSGMEVVDSIAAADTDPVDDRPLAPVAMNAVTIQRP